MRSLILIILSLLHAVLSSRVLLLVLEGLTENLLRRISTPVLDTIFDNGAGFRLKPEFPAESLPTLQAMVTGQHSELTGVLGREVNYFGKPLQYTDMMFWNYNPNITTIADLNGYSGEGLTGSVGWPGAQFYQNQENMRLWGTVYHIDQSLLEHTSNPAKPEEKRRARRIRSLSEESGVLKEQDSWGVLHGGESVEDNSSTEKEEEEEGSEDTNLFNKTKPLDKFFFNRTTDQDWLRWTGQVDTVVDWLGSEKPVNLVLFYLDQPGDKIRSFGPESEEADLAVYKVDQLVGFLLGVLEARDLMKDTNLVITGLHGFVEVSAENVYDFSNLVDSKEYTLYGENPVLNLQPVHVDQQLDIYAALQGGGDTDKYNLYNKHGIPDQYKYKNNDRVSDIVLVAKEGFAFASSFYKEVKDLNLRANRSNLLSNLYGFAGYDNNIPSMQSLLLMVGPGVVKPVLTPGRLDQVDAVDVFPLLAHLLGIQAPATNGSLDVFRSYLYNPPSHTAQVFKQAIDYIQQKENLPKAGVVIGLLVILVLLVCCCCCCWFNRSKTKDLAKNHTYRYSQVKSNRRHESRVDGSEGGPGEDKVGLLTSSALMMDMEFEETV